MYDPRIGPDKYISQVVLAYESRNVFQEKSQSRSVVTYQSRISPNRLVKRAVLSIHYRIIFQWYSQSGRADASAPYRNLSISRRW